MFAHLKRLSRPMGTLGQLSRIVLNPALLLLVTAVACQDDVSRLTAHGSRALLADKVGATGTTSRSIEEFVAAQVDPFLWTGPEQKTGARGKNLFIYIDYPGVSARDLRDAGGPDLGTTFSGTVTERANSDGTAEVHVVLHTSRAFTVAGNFDGALLFGHFGDDIINGADVALGDCDLEVTLINTAPGAPLPDLRAHFAAGRAVKSLFFRGGADGTLRAEFGVPDGTRGRAQVVQNALFQAPATADHAPAELVTLNAIGP
jgi:hypothetical protein